MKNTIKALMQGILGFERYLFVFALYIIYTLKHNRREGDFVYFRDMKRQQGLILDIGANIGAMSVHLARKHPGSEIIAFEPVPVNIKTIRRVIRHFSLKNIRVEPIALGNQKGKVTMCMPVEQKARQQGLSHVKHDSIEGYRENIEIEAPMEKLDEYLASLNDERPVTAIKLDVENFEFFVLEGARQTIEKYRPQIYCELWDNQNRYHCFALMSSLGYSVQILREKKLCIFDPEIHTTQNFFFIP